MEKLNILVIDDQKVIGDLFDFTLGFSGHTITVVDSAQKSLEIIKEKNFDIAFLDIIMPDKDGIEILKEIRELSSHLPVVMMSGYSVEDKKSQARALGAATCLKKPFEFEDIKSAIKAALGKDI